MPNIIRIVARLAAKRPGPKDPSLQWNRATRQICRASLSASLQVRGLPEPRADERPLLLGPTATLRPPFRTGFRGATGNHPYQRDRLHRAALGYLHRMHLA